MDLPKDPVLAAHDPDGLHDLLLIWDLIGQKKKIDVNWIPRNNGINLPLPLFDVDPEVNTIVNKKICIQRFSPWDDQWCDQYIVMLRLLYLRIANLEFVDLPNLNQLEVGSIDLGLNKFTSEQLRGFSITYLEYWYYESEQLDGSYIPGIAYNGCYKVRHTDPYYPIKLDYPVPFSFVVNGMPEVIDHVVELFNNPHMWYVNFSNWINATEIDTDPSNRPSLGYRKYIDFSVKYEVRTIPIACAQPSVFGKGLDPYPFAGDVSSTEGWGLLISETGNSVNTSVRGSYINFRGETSPIGNFGPADDLEPPFVFVGEKVRSFITDPTDDIPFDEEFTWEYIVTTGPFYSESFENIEQETKIGPFDVAYFPTPSDNPELSQIWLIPAENNAWQNNINFVYPEGSYRKYIEYGYDTFRYPAIYALPLGLGTGQPFFDARLDVSLISEPTEIIKETTDPCTGDPILWRIGLQGRREFSGKWVFEERNEAIESRLASHARVIEIAKSQWSREDIIMRDSKRIIEIHEAGNCKYWGDGQPKPHKIFEDPNSELPFILPGHTRAIGIAAQIRDPNHEIVLTTKDDYDQVRDGLISALWGLDNYPHYRPATWVPFDQFGNRQFAYDDITSIADHISIACDEELHYKLGLWPLESYNYAALIDGEGTPSPVEIPSMSHLLGDQYALNTRNSEVIERSFILDLQSVEYGIQNLRAAGVPTRSKSIPAYYGQIQIEEFAGSSSLGKGITSLAAYIFDSKINRNIPRSFQETIDNKLAQLEALQVQPQ